MAQFNINDEVRVRLTDRGRRLMRETHKIFCGDRVPYTEPEEVDGWSTWQLWRLMQEFGAHMIMGQEVPFEPTIEIVEPRLTDIAASCVRKLASLQNGAQS